MNRSLVVASLLAAWTPACAVLPPPAEPEATIPDVALPKVADDAGLARVIIETDVPASVSHLSEGEESWRYRGRDVTVRTLLCEETPCALTLPYGDYEIEATAIDDPRRKIATVVHVGGNTVVVNEILPRPLNQPARGGGIAAVTLGLVTAGMGIVIAALASSPASNVGSNGGTVGAITSVSGLGLAGFGTVLLATNPSEQAGVTRQWTPPPSAAAGLSFHGKF
ncbi:MAG TPA: hypothetical protein VHV30_06050 [Polyangiaceae bacterium]|jgi:hypothetical protein|nr:hypothetical protein [Polyangiaceae bacterium]